MSLPARIVGFIVVLAVLAYIMWSGGTKIVAARQTLESTKETVAVLSQSVVSQADRLLSMEKAVDLLVDLQNVNDTGQQRQVRTEYIRHLYSDNVRLAQCCPNVPLSNGRLYLAPPQPDPGFLPNHEECVKQALGGVRFSSDELLPAGAMEQGGIAPMLNFMKGTRPPASQVEVPLRPPTAAELWRDKGSAVVP